MCPRPTPPLTGSGSQSSPGSHPPSMSADNAAISCTTWSARAGYDTRWSQSGSGDWNSVSRSARGVKSNGVVRYSNLRVSLPPSTSVFLRQPNFAPDTIDNAAPPCSHSNRPGPDYPTHSPPHLTIVSIHSARRAIPIVSFSEGPHVSTIPVELGLHIGRQRIGRIVDDHGQTTWRHKDASTDNP